MSEDAAPQATSVKGAWFRRIALTAAVCASLFILFLIVLLHPYSVAVDSVYGGF